MHERYIDSSDVATFAAMVVVRRGAQREWGQSIVFHILLRWPAATTEVRSTSAFLYCIPTQCTSACMHVYKVYDTICIVYAVLVSGESVAPHNDDDNDDTDADARWKWPISEFFKSQFSCCNISTFYEIYFLLNSISFCFNFLLIYFNFNFSLRTEIQSYLFVLVIM